MFVHMKILEINTKESTCVNLFFNWSYIGMIEFLFSIGKLLNSMLQ